VCRPTPNTVAFVAVDDQVNDHAHVNDHANRAAVPSK
jgi:hypothetical protein